MVVQKRKTGKIFCRVKGLNAGLQRFGPNTATELTTASVWIPASGVRYPCPMLSGCRFWLVSVLDHFLSRLAPGCFAKIHKFCPDQDQAFAGINGGPANVSDHWRVVTLSKKREDHV